MTSINVCKNRSRSNSTVEAPPDERRQSTDKLRRSTTTAKTIDPAENAKYCSFYRRLSREVNEKIQEAAYNEDVTVEQVKQESKRKTPPPVLNGPEMYDFRKFRKEDFEKFKASKQVYKGAEVVTKKWE
ncbi:hypothetical protein TI39_contig4206g00002 [Zymoseptoria brevis]|uniref:Uncharacterized protein n=1 Tax=Zymoseptoria brevis TaxID=1047168 RepID=A0A0F4GA65_9PEZI|nr:hypothetical protein TI39_contig4206g00002 [Zymoseptoria brevis]